jgi:hypothetical protein
VTDSIRYVMGLGPGDDGTILYSVVRLVENEQGERTANPVIVIGDMTEEQARHLHKQLGNALGATVPA